MVPSGGKEQLTYAELHVLHRIARGESDHAIAQALHLPITCIGARMETVMRYLGVVDRPHAVCAARNQHLLD